MEDLLPSRVTITHAFIRVGVEYAEPFGTKVMKGRIRIIMKSHSTLFTCLTTKDVHLEIVSSLNIEAFLATLNRFVSRRIYPPKLYLQ